jgi:hypothetical protein
VAELIRFIRRRQKRQVTRRRHTTFLSASTNFARRDVAAVANAFCPWFLVDELEIDMSLEKYCSTGNFLKQADVPRPLLLTIAATATHKFEDKMSEQLVLIWREPNVKPLVCNATVVRSLGVLLNVTEEAQLIGRQIEVFTDPTVQMRGAVVGGLRVRLPSQPVFPGQSQPPVAPAAGYPQEPAGYQQPSNGQAAYQQPAYPQPAAALQQPAPPNYQQPPGQAPPATDEPW